MIDLQLLWSVLVFHRASDAAKLRQQLEPGTIVAVTGLDLPVVRRAMQDHSSLTGLGGIDRIQAEDALMRRVAVVVTPGFFYAAELDYQGKLVGEVRWLAFMWLNDANYECPYIGRALDPTHVHQLRNGAIKPLRWTG